MHDQNIALDFLTNVKSSVKDINNQQQCEMIYLYDDQRYHKDVPLYNTVNQ